MEVDLTWYEEQSSLLNRHLPDCHPQFDAPRLNLMLTATPAINSLGTDVWAEGIAAWIADQQGRSNPPRDPMAALRFFLSKRASALPGEGVHTVHTSKNFGAPADPSKIWEGLRITGVGDVDAPDAMLAAKLARRTQQPVKATA